MTLPTLLGWRGAIGLAVGALLAALPAYELGVWTEAAVGRERIARSLAERDVLQMEIENARIDSANSARSAAIAGASGRGVSNDGYRRD